MCNMQGTMIGKSLLGQDRKLGRLKFGMMYDKLMPDNKSFIDKDPKIRAEMRKDKQSKKNNGGNL